MKKINLFAIASASLMMFACTDYETQVDDHYEENIKPSLDQWHSESQEDPCASAIDLGLCYSMMGCSDYSVAVSKCKMDYTTYCSFYPTTSSCNIGGNSSDNDAGNDSGNDAGNNSGNGCGDLWCGYNDSEGWVETDSETGTAGWWYTFDDNSPQYSGNSEIKFPSDVEENAYGNFFGPLIEAYGGIKGTAVLGDAYDYAFAGLGFNLVSENQEGMDITDWQGLCITYYSAAPFALELVPEDEANYTGYNNYKASITKSSVLTTVDFPWSKFKQESSWGETVDLYENLQRVAAIKLRFTARSGDFFFYTIGRLGTCGN